MESWLKSVRTSFSAVSGGRYTTIFLALFLLVVASVFAYRPATPPQYDGVDEVGLSPLHLKWWTRPYEVNTFLRPSLTTGELSSAVRLLDNKTFLAVGENGVILRSIDSGRHWSRVATPVQAGLNQLLPLSDGTTVIAIGDAGTILRSIDKGRHWGKIESPTEENLYRLTVLSNGTTIVVEEADSAILRSTDRGLHWRELPSPLKENAFFAQKLVVQSAGTIFAFPSGGTVMRSTDLGDHWLPTELAFRIFLPVKNSRILMAIDRNGSLLRSVDQAATWSQVQAPASSIQGAITALKDGKTLLATDENGNILQSTNQGTSWETINSPPNIGPIEFLPLNDNRTVIALEKNGSILRSTNRGADWKEVSNTGGNNDLASLNEGPGQRLLSTDDDKVIIAIGMYGAIHRSTDQGASWTLVSSFVPNSITAMATVGDTKTIVAVGGHRALMRSTNSGASWKSIGGPENDILFKIFPLKDKRTVLATGIYGTVMRSENEGFTWSRVTNPSNDFIDRIVSINQDQTLIATGGSTPLRSTDKGAHWTPLSWPSITRINELEILEDSGTVLVFQNSGELLRSTDLGASWSKITLPAVAVGIPVVLRDNKTLMVPTATGTILRSVDRGATWTDTKFPSPEADENILEINQNGVLIATGYKAPILRSVDHGATWARTDGATTDPANQILASNDGRAIFVIQSNGVVLHSTDLGITWTTRENPNLSEYLLNQILLLDDGTTLVAASEDGKIIYSGDSGDHWKIVNNKTNSQVTRLLALKDGKTILLSGMNGTLLRSTDKGKHWTSVGYQKYLPPISIACVSLALALLVWSLWPRKPEPILGLEGIAVSDNPVTDLKDDRLDRAALVGRLRQFVTNPKTYPPLVISVQGAWGSGKSSILKMLQKDLEARKKARTVWFNAWHCNDEDRLLINLLDAVESQCVPPFYTPAGLLFRLRLYWLRFRASDRDAAVAFYGLLLIIFGLVLQYLPSDLHAAQVSEVSDLKGLFTTNLFQKLEEWQVPQVLKPVKWSAPFLWGLGSLLSLLQLKAFNASPADVVKEGRNSLKEALKPLLSPIKILNGKDVRREFSENLKDVVDVLKPGKRLVIFLDDLDRCRPENIVRILEAVNFLSTAAECIIFLGADYKKVQTLVSLEYEKIAIAEKKNEMAYKASVWPEPSAAKTRREYARAFMEKIVNLRINLPRLHEEKVREMLTNTPSPSPNPWGLANMVYGVILIAAATFLWFTLNTLPAEAPEQPSVASPATLIFAPDATPGKAANIVSSPVQAIKQKPEAPQKLTQADARPYDRNAIGLTAIHIVFPLACLFAGLIGLGYLLLRRLPVADEKESNAFKAALEAGSLELVEALKTPREVRRFLNYLRLVTAPGDAGTKSRISAIRVRLAAAPLAPFVAAQTGIAPPGFSWRRPWWSLMQTCRYAIAGFVGTMARVAASIPPGLRALAASFAPGKIQALIKRRKRRLACRTRVALYTLSVTRDLKTRPKTIAAHDARARQKTRTGGDTGFDAQIVKLAVAAATGQYRTAIAKTDTEVVAIFREGCQMFGLDPQTFNPEQNGD